MVEIVVTSIICVTILLLALIINSTDWIDAKVKKEIELLKEKRVSDSLLNKQWREMLELEAKLSIPPVPEIPESEELIIAELEAKKAVADAEKMKAAAEKTKLDIENEKLHRSRYR